jgi:hypothetical protein
VSCAAVPCAITEPRCTVFSISSFDVPLSSKASCGALVRSYSSLAPQVDQELRDAQARVVDNLMGANQPLGANQRFRACAHAELGCAVFDLDVPLLSKSFDIWSALMSQEQARKRAPAAGADTAVTRTLPRRTSRFTS